MHIDAFALMWNKMKCKSRETVSLCDMQQHLIKENMKLGRKMID